MDGLTQLTSYLPTRTLVVEESLSYWIWVLKCYTGVEGLTVGYATGEVEQTVGSEADATTMKASYAYGPVTVGYQTLNLMMVQLQTNDEEITSYKFLTQ